MKQSVITTLAVIGTIAIVACSLLLPRQMIVASDEKLNGQVNAAEKDYYTGALEAFAGEDDFYTRMMLLTGKWVSREEKMETYVYDVLSSYGAVETDELGINVDGENGSTNVKTLDTIRRISVDYWKDETTYSKPAFLAQGNAVRTVCNLTAFDLMPELLNLYYESWAFINAQVYRYTDLLLRKYECDAVRFVFGSNGWEAKAELLVDITTGNFIGLWIAYDSEMATKWLEELERLEIEWIETEGDPEEEIKSLQSELEKYRQWKKTFIAGETTGRTTLDLDVSEFLDRIGFSMEKVVTDEAELAEVAIVPHEMVSEENAISYTYVANEKSSGKKFYFVISSSEGSFEAYFSPMTEKTSGNNLTEQ